MHLPTATLLAVLAVPPAAAAQGPAQFTVRTPAAVSAATLVAAAAADFDGDGDLDLCGCGHVFTLVRQVLLRNDGGERFTNVTATNLPVVTSQTLCTLAFDMDGDGDQDLFLGKSGAQCCLWRNTGGGMFVDASANLPAAAGLSAAIAADLDGDGDLDIAAVGTILLSATVRLFMNNGSGMFTDVGGPFYHGTAVVALDLDRDGDLDLAITDLNTTWIYRNDGNMAFNDVTATWLGSGAFGGHAFAAGDLDGDGDADLVVARRFLPDLVLRNTGTTFVTAAVLPVLGGNTDSAILADLDLDGDLDLLRASLNFPLSLEMQTNDGTGTFTNAAARLPPVPANSFLMAVADFDRDGDPDVLMSAAFVPMMLVNQHRDLQVGAARSGQTWTVELWSQPGYATQPHLGLLGIGLARLPQPLTLPVFGELWLDLVRSHLLATGLVPPATGRLPFSFAVPSLPQLQGIELHVQGLLDQSPMHLTACRSVYVQ